MAGKSVRLIVTDVGVDVLCDAEDPDDVRAALEQAGATPVSEAATAAWRPDGRATGLSSTPA